MPGNVGIYSAYATLALGSALALFLYPHSVTGLLSASNRNVIKRNMALLPAYSLVLALIAFLGYMAIAAGVQQNPAYADFFKQYGTNFAVPALLLQSFSSWFVGVSFAAIAIGALVPAAIMSIASANLFTCNIYKEYLKPDATPQQQARVAKFMSLLVKVGALCFIIFLPEQYAIQFQLLGGVWIIQTLPSVVCRPVYALVPPLGARGGLAGGDARGDRDGRHPGLQQLDLPAAPGIAHRARLRGALLPDRQLRRSSSA